MPACLFACFVGWSHSIVFGSSQYHEKHIFQSVISIRVAHTLLNGNLLFLEYHRWSKCFKRKWRYIIWRKEMENKEKRGGKKDFNCKAAKLIRSEMMIYLKMWCSEWRSIFFTVTKSHQERIVCGKPNEKKNQTNPTSIKQKSHRCDLTYFGMHTWHLSIDFYPIQMSVIRFTFHGS